MNPRCISESTVLFTHWKEAECAERFTLYTACMQSLADGDRLDAVHQRLRPLIAELVTQSHAARLQFVQTICRSDKLHIVVFNRIADFSQRANAVLAGLAGDSTHA